MHGITYRKAEEIKDSKVDWIGSIPLKWEIETLKRIYMDTSGNGFPIHLQGEESGEIPFYKVSDINIEGLYVGTSTNYVSKKLANTNKWSVIKPYSILMAKIGEALKKNHRTINLSECLIDNNLLALTNRKGNRRFYYYVMNVVDMLWFANPGAVPSINMRYLRNTTLPWCDEVEQQKIANFLDIKTAQFDSIIAKKELLIQKLEEAKKSLISEVVTGKVKIINGEMVPRKPEEMKDSGVEWLGMIPKDWYTKKISHLTDIYRGRFNHRPRNDIKLYENGHFPFVQTGDIARCGKYLTDYTQSLNKMGVGVSKSFPINTLLMTIAANIGELAIAKISAYYPDSIVGFYPKDGVDVEYLYYLFTGMKQELFKVSVVNTQANLNIERISSIQCSIPSYEVQANAVKYLNKKIAAMEKIVTYNQSQIENFVKAKQSLISEAVTGKIDLRDWEIIEVGEIQ